MNNVTSTLVAEVFFLLSTEFDRSESNLNSIEKDKKENLWAPASNRKIHPCAVQREEIIIYFLTTARILLVPLQLIQHTISYSRRILKGTKIMHAKEET